MILKLGVLTVLAGSCWAGEYAVLTTGFRLHADRHEIAGTAVRLYDNGGVTELAAAQVAGFEPDEETPKSSEPPITVPQSAEDLVESGYRADAVSRKGAIGLMQLMPDTARLYGADPTDPKQNVEAGTQYLRDLLWKYRNDDHQVSRALAAYNAGPKAVDRYHGIPPYRETIAYVERVLRRYEKQVAAQARAKSSAD